MIKKILDRLFPIKNKKSFWVHEYLCKNCKEIMRFYTVMHSHGVCPYCGYNSKCTIIDTITKVKRKVYKGWFNYEWEYKNE